VLFTPQAPHESRIFHTETPAKVSLIETHTHTDTKRDPHTELEETREMKFPQLLYYRERDTQRRKAAFFFFFPLCVCPKSAEKSPMKTYMVNHV
jgi:hypothetical protein